MIHPTAIVDPKAELGEGVEVGPNAIIEAGVTVGARTKIGPMVHIQGTTILGEDNVVMTGATLGFPPQFLGFSGAPTRCIIGGRNVIREYASIHRGLTDESATTIGDENFIMGFSHVAHDCRLGSRIVLANGALLAGHVTVGDRVFISGNVCVHQFCRIGRLAMLAGLARVTRDVPPFMMAEGHPAKLRGLNTVGLRRAEIASQVRSELRRLLREIYQSSENITQMLRTIKPTDYSDEGKELLEFFQSSKRGVTPFSLSGVKSTTGDSEVD
ncbi:MAG: acyl-ACP--UDP-N-acetylglucosamine O-acyltransferase [bacterium]|nr:acyl-ACP--UDP-N-acetylglucosamine O-acyltransferase [bacterium]